MSKQNLFTIFISASLSVVLSITANLILERERGTVRSDVVRTRKVELIDEQGRIRGTFELASDGAGGVLPLLVMRDNDGRDSIDMGVDGKGNGVISFASEHWNEGTVILGHLNLVDPEAANQPIKEVDKSGAWGLQIRSPQNKYTGVGFFNSGKPIAPMTDNLKR